MNQKNIGIFLLTVMIVSAIDSIRNMPATALFGSQLVFYFLLSALLFLIPSALVSAELASSWNEHEGGIYAWVKAAFGKKVGFYAVWLQWVNTLVWYPTILSFMAGTLAYLVDPALVHNKYYMIVMLVGIFWISTAVNLRGLKTAAWVSSFGLIFGMLIPLSLMIALGVIWLATHHHAAISLAPHAFIPKALNHHSCLAITAIMTSFLGLELSASYACDVANPTKTFPKALVIAVVVILVTMIAGSLTIAVVLPEAHISLVAGIMQTFQQFFVAYHLSWLLPILAVMIVLSAFGGMNNWIISPVRGLLYAAESGLLPQALTKLNSAGVPARLMVIQSTVVTVITGVFLLVPSVNGSYWLLTDLSTELYMLMYLIMFVSAIVLRFKLPNLKRPFTVPGGRAGLIIFALLGVVGTILTLIVGFIPPAGLNVGGVLRYELIFAGGLVLMSLPAIIYLCLRRSR